MNVKELREKLEAIEKDHPDAEVRIDLPYSRVLAAYYLEDENVVELDH